MVGRANQLHYDTILTNVSVKYQAPGLIADRIFPIVPVRKESDLWPVYDLGQFLVVDDTRQDGDTAKQVGWGWKLEYYVTEQHSTRMLITPRQRENVDAPIDLEVDTTEFLTRVMMLNHEREAARTIQDPANNVAAVNLANAWSNYLTASPKEAIMEASNAIFRASGLRPNTIVIPSTIVRRMLLIEEIKEERKYTNDLTQSGLPNPLWGLEVLEAAAVGFADYQPQGVINLDPTNPNAVPNLSEIWGNNVWIGYVDKPGLRKLAYGATFVPRQRNVRRYIDPERDNGTWIEVDWIYGIKVIARVCGYLLTNVM